MEEPAMKLRTSSIPLMLKYVTESGTGQKDLQAAAEIFNHEDYLFEARRYGLDSREPLVSYFSRFKTIPPEDIPELCPDRKTALLDRHKLWLDCAAHPQKYQDRYSKLMDMLTEKNLLNLQDRLRAMFPGDVNIDDSYVISTLSFGPSFGYVHENALHLDLFGIETYCTMKELPFVILHEMHHLQTLKMMGAYESFTKKFSILERYIFRFTGEGMAIKFCNNAEGVVSKRLNPDLDANIGIPAMLILNRHFSEHLSLFQDTVRKIEKGLISEEEINRQFMAYWWNPRLYPQEKAFLEQTPIYSFGNELFGSIYDAFGLDVMFQCFFQPGKALELFRPFR